jgi:hypothetical protein
MAKRPVSATEATDDGREPTLLYLVGRIDRVVRRAMGSVLTAQGLSVNQYATLSVLTLGQRGLVGRRAHPDHGRILQARLTAKGRALLARCDAEVHEVEARMVSGLSEDEQAALRGALLSSIRALHGGLQP